jgi:cation diffusion facilitator family transporter
MTQRRWTHRHVFDEGNPLAQRRTLWAVILTAGMMVAEIAGGWLFNSMALLADGWHMSSHALALGLSVLAYMAARRLKDDTRFAFGTWKIEVLGGYTSAVLLVLVAALMFYQSIERLFAPTPIRYDEAIPVAALGLAVNLLCAWLLKDGHAHHHGHSDSPGHDDKHHYHGNDDAHGRDGTHAPHGHVDGHAKGHAHRHHHDLNLRAAYLHVVADAATSVLAILALCGGRFWGFNWLDPVMGIVGATLVSVWAFGLLRDAGRALLDAEMDAPVVKEIKDVISECPIKADICDLHVWRVGKGKYACILSLVTTKPVTPDYFKQQLTVHEELVHVTIEVNQAA